MTPDSSPFTSHFDAILMDVQMPQMGGFEATAIIRTHEKGTEQHIPIIAMTAHALKGDRDRCLEAGMDDYVSKPVRAEELYEVLARLGSSAGETLSEPPARSDKELDRAEMLERLAGDWNLLREMIRLFFDLYPGMLKELRQAVSSGNTVEVRRVAHSLKGAVGNFGAHTSHKAALQLETMGRTGDLSQAAEALAALEEALEQLRPRLTGLLNE